MSDGTHCEVLRWYCGRTTLKRATISSTLKVGHSIGTKESTTCTLPKRCDTCTPKLMDSHRNEGGHLSSVHYH